jgi:L-alanine-DL-glutamate epimerase-like enolase superfamily enzyme
MRAPRVTDVERTLVSIPFHPRTAAWTRLLAAHWGVIEVLRVRTEDPDIVGHGETLVDYTWARVTDEAVSRVIGHPPARHLFEDSLGAGLQMALADAAGKAAGVPVHRLLPAATVRDAVPISWWCADLPPELLAEEAADAVEQRYTSLKLKARPWFDIIDQVEAVSAVTPSWFRLDIDWNSTLLTASAALPVLRALDEYERVGIYESPIPRADVTGQRFLRERVRRPIAEHYDATTFESTLRAEAVDGFVSFGAGLAGMVDQGHRFAAARKDFFLQMVGTGLTTMLSAHLGAVLVHARWPAISAMNTFAEDLITAPLEIREGFVAVPDRPGLGVELDESAVSRHAITSDQVPQAPRTVITWSVPGRRDRSYAAFGDLWRDVESDGRFGPRPVGSRISVREDDGSDEFDSLHAAAAAAVLIPHRVRGY